MSICWLSSQTEFYLKALDTTILFNCKYIPYISAFPNQQCKRIPKVASNNFTKKTPIKAVYGVVDMEVNRYLVVVTKATVIGQIYHRKVFQVQKVDFVCINSS